MKKALIALTAMVPLALVAAWTAKANPMGVSLRPPAQSYLMEQIGCEGGPSPKDRCPYGYRLERHGCEPCGQRHGSRYRDWNDRYYEPRRYRDYGDRYYEPRRYPREY
jgi:hypothetical protein